MPKFDVDDDLVRKLAKLLNDTGLAELEFAEGEKRIRLTRGGVSGSIAAPVTIPVAVEVSKTEKPADENANAITSPMVGTAYLSAQPGSKPFVAVGDKVKAGDTVLIIEAMKVMNPIKAPKGGSVKKILIADAQPIEFGQPLIVIE
jgi:acetyl-CoA carboxylase biotin carboxyl carrier protein